MGQVKTARPFDELRVTTADGGKGLKSKGQKSKSTKVQKAEEQKCKRAEGAVLENWKTPDPEPCIFKNNNAPL